MFATESGKLPTDHSQQIRWAATFVVTQTTSKSVTARRLRACCTGACRRRAALPAPPGPPSDRPPQSVSVEEVSRLARSAPLASGVSPSPDIDKLLLWTDMSNPDDDTDVPSGFNDDAEMERTSPRASETRRCDGRCAADPR